MLTLVYFPFTLQQETCSFYKCLHVGFVSSKLVLKKCHHVLDDFLHCHQQKPSLLCPFAYLLSLFLHLKIAIEANNPSKIKLSIQPALHYKGTENCRQSKQESTKQFWKGSWTCDSSQFSINMGTVVTLYLDTITFIPLNSGDRGRSPGGQLEQSHPYLWAADECFLPQNIPSSHESSFLRFGTTPAEFHMSLQKWAA